MTRIKVIMKNVEVLEFKEVQSKKGNKYQIVTVNHNNNNVDLYDPDIRGFDVGSFYDIELEVVISKYSNIKVLNCYKIKQDEKKGFFNK